MGHFGVNIEDGNGSSIQYIFMIFCTYIIYIKSSAIELRKTVEMAQNILHILMGLTSWLPKAYNQLLFFKNNNNVKSSNTKQTSLYS